MLSHFLHCGNALVTLHYCWQLILFRDFRGFNVTTFLSHLSHHRLWWNNLPTSQMIKLRLREVEAGAQSHRAGSGYEDSNLDPRNPTGASLLPSPRLQYVPSTTSSLIVGLRLYSLRLSTQVHSLPRLRSSWLLISSRQLYPQTCSLASDSNTNCP